MKKCKLGLLSLSCLMTFGITNTSNGELTCYTVDQINETANLKAKFIKNVQTVDRNINHSTMYVQYAKKDNQHYLRFATAIEKNSITSLDYEMKINGKTYNDGKKSASTLYKGIVANGKTQYYDGVNLSEEVNEDYLWTCYVIKFESEKYLNDNIEVLLTINESETISKSTSLKSEIEASVAYNSTISSVTLEQNNNEIYWVFNFENSGYKVEDYEFYDDGDKIFEVASSEIINNIATFKINVTNFEGSHYPHLRLKGEKISDTGDIELSESAFDENGKITEISLNDCHYSLRRLNDDSTMPIIEVTRNYRCSAKTASIIEEEGRAYWKFVFENTWYGISDYEFLGDNDTKLDAIGEKEGNDLVFKIDVTDFSNGTYYPHLKIKGNYYSVGGSNAGDIKGGDLTFVDGKQIQINNKIYTLIKEWDMPAIIIKDVKEKLVRKSVTLSEEDGKLYYNFKFFSYYGVNYDYSQTSFVILDGDRSVTFGKNGIAPVAEGGYVTFKVDVSSINTESDFYPHLKINGVAWAEDGSADNGDIKGQEEDNNTIIQEIEFDGAKYQIVALWNMPVLRKVSL